MNMSRLVRMSRMSWLVSMSDMSRLVSMLRMCGLVMRVESKSPPAQLIAHRTEVVSESVPMEMLRCSEL